MKTEEIKRLIDEYKRLEQSQENLRRRSMWKGIARSGRDQFRPTPKTDRSWKDGMIPITADIQNPTWSRIFKFDIRKFYFDAQTFLENYLKIMIFRFKNFQDDTFLTTDIPMWGSTALEGSLFGLKFVTLEGKDPELELIPVINSVEDLTRMQPVDFKTSGIMPQIINVYEDVCELCNDEGINVLFPEWIRSPFGVAVYIRGFEDLLVDMITDEEFYHGVMRYITDSRKEWFKGLEKYLGKPVKKANLYNDEVSCPTLSPGLYKNKVFQYEQELCDFHGGLHYWHSCGNVSDLTCEIAKLSDLDLFNVGPWTSALAAGKAFRDKTPLEICMNPQKDILEGTRESMTKRLTDIKKDCMESDICGFGLKISALNAYDNLEDMLRNIILWIEVARKVSQIRM
jgi:hypothetical protein